MLSARASRRRTWPCVRKWIPAERSSANPSERAWSLRGLRLWLAARRSVRSGRRPRPGCRRPAAIRGQPVRRRVDVPHGELDRRQRLDGAMQIGMCQQSLDHLELQRFPRKGPGVDRPTPAVLRLVREQDSAVEGRTARRSWTSAECDSYAIHAGYCGRRRMIHPSSSISTGTRGLGHRSRRGGGRGDRGLRRPAPRRVDGRCNHGDGGPVLVQRALTHAGFDPAIFGALDRLSLQIYDGRASNSRRRGHGRGAGPARARRAIVSADEANQVWPPKPSSSKLAAWVLFRGDGQKLALRAQTPARGTARAAGWHKRRRGDDWRLTGQLQYGGRVIVCPFRASPRMASALQS